MKQFRKHCKLLVAWTKTLTTFYDIVKCRFNDNLNRAYNSLHFLVSDLRVYINYKIQLNNDTAQNVKKKLIQLQNNTK